MIQLNSPEVLPFTSSDILTILGSLFLNPLKLKSQVSLWKRQFLGSWGLHRFTSGLAQIPHRWFKFQSQLRRESSNLDGSFQLHPHSNSCPTNQRKRLLFNFSTWNDLAVIGPTEPIFIHYNGFHSDVPDIGILKKYLIFPKLPYYPNFPRITILFYYLM